MLKKLLNGLILFSVMISQYLAAQDFANVQINAVKVTENIFMLEGRGGNIGLFFGPQGIFLVDDQFAPLHEKITSKVKEITTGAVPENSKMFVINTHFHGDHTGGNELMGQTGAIIIAHENVRKRLSAEQFSSFFNRTTPPSPDGALPIITFTNDLTFHLNGDSINVYHVESAHTDGDAIIHFTKANVIHSGDILFTNSYPLIDLDGGGSVAGLISAVETILGLCNEQTKVIPGHGPLTNKSEIQQYHDMLITCFSRVSYMVEQGKSLEEIKAAKPTNEFDKYPGGFVSPDRFVEILYRDATTPN